MSTKERMEINAFSSKSRKLPMRDIHVIIHNRSLMAKFGYHSRYTQEIQIPHPLKIVNNCTRIPNTCYVLSYVLCQIYYALCLKYTLNDFFVHWSIFNGKMVRYTHRIL